MKNYYYSEDQDNNITGLFRRPQHKDQKFLPEVDQIIIDYLENQKSEEEKYKNGMYTKIDEAFEGANTIATLKDAIIKILKGL